MGIIGGGGSTSIPGGQHRMFDHDESHDEGQDCCCGGFPPQLPPCCNDWCGIALDAGKLVRGYVTGLPGCAIVEVLQPLGPDRLCLEWTGSATNCGDNNSDIGIFVECLSDPNNNDRNNYRLGLDCFSPDGDELWEGFATAVTCGETINDDTILTFGPVNWAGICNGETGFTITVTMKVEDP